MKCKFCLRPATYVCTYTVPDPRIVMPEEIHELDLVRDDVSLIYRPVKKLVLSYGDEYACVKFAIEK